MSDRRLGALVCVSAIAVVATAFADLDSSYVLPLSATAIQYATRPLADPVTLLQQQIKRGEAKLDYDPVYGYLPSVLRNLGVPISSQVLVFSKTSFQAPRISPGSPRAIYFNDQVSVGWVPGGEVVEVASVDPRQGVIFYTVSQEHFASAGISGPDFKRSPEFKRNDECLQCHASGNTLGVPGFVVRSVYPDASGQPLLQLGTFITDHRSPINQRWGGYYVSGTHGTQTHLGNMIYEAAGMPRPVALNGNNVTDLRDRFDTTRYLSADSDIVALMTLEHQSRMQNLITRVGYETRMALELQTAMNDALKEPSDTVSESTARRINGASDELARYMLFADEAAIDDRIAGSSHFASEFAAQGPKDRRGRSLRQFELTHRMFQYPCSYLIYSDAFDKLPEFAKKRIYLRLWEVLTGRDRSPSFAKLSSADRQAVLEILLDTKRDLPSYWRTSESGQPQ